MRARAWVAAAIAALATAVLPASAAATTNPLVEPTGSLATGHGRPLAAPLPGGDVLVAAGYYYLSPQDRWGGTNKRAEIFDPATGSFTPLTDETTTGRRDGAAAPLGDGRILIAGGGWSEGAPFASAEIFDPSTQEFTATGSMANARKALFAAPLPDGRVLVGGGTQQVPDGQGHATWVTLDSTEIYDPASGEFTPGPSMTVPRSLAAAAPLPDGRVLVMGGRNGFLGFQEGWSEWLPTTEIYDPASETFEPGPAAPFNWPHSATSLENGRILVVGDTTLREYDPAAEAFVDTGIDSTPYRSSAAAPLPGGRALLSGFESYKWGPEEKQAWIYLTAPLVAGEGIDFGEVPVGETSGPDALTVTNEGAQGLEIETASLGGSDASAFKIVEDECSGETLAFGEACSIEVTVTPASVGPLTAAVELTDNAPSGPASLPLSATAITGGERKAAGDSGGERKASGGGGGGEHGGAGSADTALAGAAATTPPTSGPAAKKPRRICRKGHTAGKQRKGKAAKRVRCAQSDKGSRMRAL